MKYYYLSFLSVLCLSLACVKKEETPIRCTLNNLELVEGVCNCPKNKFRLNDGCITPNTNTYYGIGNNFNYFDTLSLSVYKSSNIGIYPTVFMTASEQNYSLGGTQCEYFQQPSGDSVVFSSLDNFWVNNTKCYVTFSGKYSIDKREIKMQLRWRNQSSLQPIDTTYMTLRNYIQ